MSRYQWLENYQRGLREADVDLHEVDDIPTLAGAKELDVEIADWGMVAKVGAELGARWCGVWGDHHDAFIRISAVIELEGDYLILRTDISAATPVLPSHTPWYPGADRMERHVQDMLGVAFLDHPDERRWIRHQAWRNSEYPLRNDFPLQGVEPPEITPSDADYAFEKVMGAAVYEIPVGPVHAGVIEPGHFRFQAVGEHILQLEQHLGYVHKGIEKLAVGRDAAGLVRLAARVSGDSTVAHGWAACQAFERATGVQVPERALVLRALMAERERVANHLGDIGAICNDVGFAFAHMQMSRLREKWQRRSKEVFGHRMMMDRVIPGGVAADISASAGEKMIADIAEVQRDLARVNDVIEDNPSLLDRLVTTGYLSQKTATALGCLGYVGRASGVDKDVRRDRPYAPYDRLAVKVPTSTVGDVATRVKIRVLEIQASFDLQKELLRHMPAGEIVAPPVEVREECEGLGVVDGFRGEIMSYVRVGDDGLVRRFFPRDPSWFNWPALQEAVLKNIVPDFPVCNKSVNGSYSGQDL